MAKFIFTGEKFINLDNVLTAEKKISTNPKNGKDAFWWYFNMVDGSVEPFQARDRDHSRHIHNQLLGEDGE